MYSNICGTRCGGYSVQVAVNESDVRNLYIPPYSCPTSDDPNSLTQCCEPLQYRCCAARKRQFFEIDQSLGVGIAVTVVLLATLLIVVLITCCCWERCPLYLICRAEAKPDYLGAYSQRC
ncbi:unnamed protein product [Soboliphyme baturini]|uniref:Uncharacterized protein n=1 Tax=Soboliphyme baturini TaxID=241478 RepID=A0A183IXK0_9BILA|nr:unnamed protein product [Soboliphyme baturini]